MKKRGVTFIETVVAITIFLIGILPVAMLTLNSLSNLKKASEIEEGKRIATTVINYIKSRGYDNIMTTTLGGNDDFSASYHLAYSSADGAYIVVDKEEKTVKYKPNENFETDFYGYDDSSDGNIFFIENLGIELEEAVIDVVMKKSSLYLATTSSGVIYNNPVSASPSSVTIIDSDNTTITTTGSAVIIGPGDGTDPRGISADPIIYGLVRVRYISKAKPGETAYNKKSKQTFVVTPLENF